MLSELKESSSTIACIDWTILSSVVFFYLSLKPYSTSVLSLAPANCSMSTGGGSDGSSSQGLRNVPEPCEDAQGKSSSSHAATKDHHLHENSPVLYTLGNSHTVAEPPQIHLCG